MLTWGYMPHGALALQLHNRIVFTKATTNLATSYLMLGAVLLVNRCECPDEGCIGRRLRVTRKGKGELQHSYEG